VSDFWALSVMHTALDELLPALDALLEPDAPLLPPDESPAAFAVPAARTSAASTIPKDTQLPGLAFRVRFIITSRTST
jgi:hypothetical protein